MLVILLVPFLCFLLLSFSFWYMPLFYVACYLVILLVLIFFFYYNVISLRCETHEVGFILSCLFNLSVRHSLAHELYTPKLDLILLSVSFLNPLLYSLSSYFTLGVLYYCCWCWINFLFIKNNSIETLLCGLSLIIT